MNKFTLIFCFLVFQNLVFAGNDIDISGGKSKGMGNTSVMYSDIWSISNNQAGLAFIKNPAVGLYYENKFTMAQTGYQSLAMAIPTKKTGTFGLNVSYFGYSEYNESKVSLAYGKKLGDKFAVGLKVNYLNIGFSDEYGSKGKAIAEIGVLYEPKDKLFIGAHIYNITREMIAKDTDDDNVNNQVAIPTNFRLGLGYKFTDNVFVATEVEKDLENKPVFKVGVDYQVVEKFFLRAGMSTNPNQTASIVSTLTTFGMGYKSENFNVDLAFINSSALGMSSQISVYYIFD
jgi:hypothetical protein